MDLVPASQFTIEELTDAYNQTRVDYLVPMPMTARRLQEYIEVYDVDLEGSVTALVDGEIGGLCMLGVRGDWGWITRLGVLPTARRRGLGRAMMEYCIEQAALRGIKTVYLEVIEGNTPAHSLFTWLGFEETRRLLILRRPPGLPPEDASPDSGQIEWLDEEEIIERAANRPWRPAWTNHVESLVNAGHVKGLHVIEEDGRGGWVSYQRSALQLKRVIVAPDEGVEVAPAHALLHHLHASFPRLDTIAENVPADAPHLEAFFQHGYVESFARIEMELPLIP